MEKRMLFIVNPCAGLKKVEGYLSRILQVFCRNGWIPTVLMTEYAGHARELAQKYAAGFDMVVCAGGDGTLNEVISGLLAAKLDLPIGYLPCGTTNDFASTLGLSRNLVTAAEDVMAGAPRQVDVGTFNGRSFIYTASFGAFTKSSYETPQGVKNVLGHLAYVLSGIKELGQIKPTFARIKTEKGEYSGDYLFGSVSNTTSLAGVLTIDEEIVKLDDGEFELLLVDMPTDIISLNLLLMNLAQKKFGEMLHLCSAREITIETYEDVDWTLDGELETGRRKFEIVNMPRAVRIIAPARNENLT